MLDPQYPCAICTCSYWKHYTSLAGGKPVCLICLTDAYSSGEGIKRSKHDPIHEFSPDNLRWLEMKEAAANSVKGMQGITFTEIHMDESHGS